MSVTSQLLAALYEALEYLECFEDVVDGPDGEPRPNAAMRVASTVREAIAAGEAA